MSLDHIWVDYPGKETNILEDPALEVAGRRDGRLFLRWPRRFDLRREAADQVALYWTPSPVGRRLLLAFGLTLIGLWNPLASLLAVAGTRAGVRVAGGAAGAAAPPPRRGAGRSSGCRCRL